MSDQNTGTAPDAATADETNADTTETPTVESLQEALDKITAESRKWESRAKDNFEARKELDALKASQMTDAEKAEAASKETEQRLADAEKRAADAEAALARYSVATEFGLSKEDAEALAAVSDPDALRALAERLAGRSGPRPNPAQGQGNKPAPTTKAQAFADALGDLF